MENEHENQMPDWEKALGQASALYEKGGDSRVPAMFHSLRVVIHELEQAGANRETLKPMIALLHGLDQLNHGQASSVLTPRKGFSAIVLDPDRGAFVAQQAIAIVVQEIFYRSLGGRHGKRRDAQAQAAKLLARSGFRSRRGHPITHDILRQWCSAAKRKGDNAELLRQCVSQYEAMLPEHSKGSVQFAEELVFQVTTHPFFQMSQTERSNET